MSSRIKHRHLLRIAASALHVFVVFLWYRDTSVPATNGSIWYKREKYRVSAPRFCFMFSITRSLFTVRPLRARTDQFMGKRRIKFSPNDNPSLTSPEKTNGAPRWCFNITNYLGVLGKGTDVALRKRKGWGAGQGHHTPRLGSDKHGWLGVFTCPRAIKGRRGQGLESYGSSVAPLRAWGAGEGRGTEVQHCHMPGLYSWPHWLLWAVTGSTLTKLLMSLSLTEETCPPMQTWWETT